MSGCNIAFHCCLRLFGNPDFDCLQMPSLRCIQPLTPHFRRLERIERKARDRRITVQKHLKSKAKGLLELAGVHHHDPQRKHENIHANK